MGLGYAVKEGMAGFRRAKLASFTSVTALIVAVLLTGVLTRLGFGGFDLVQRLRSSFDVEVYLKDVSQRRVRVLQNRLETLDHVNTVGYISKDSAAVIFMRDFGEGGEELAGLGFLPASFRVTFNENTSVDQINAQISTMSGLSGVDEITFDEQLLRLLDARIQTVVIVGGVIGGVIFFASILLVFNTIRLTIYAKRNLIRAMKLVGATNRFVRRPFLIEGIVQGVVGGTFAVGLMWLFFEYLVPEFIPDMGLIAWPMGRWYYLVGGMMVLGLMMGFFGSRWAAGRFISDTSLQ